nr:uncharacterized protein LOC119168062 isoform X1 [Rhipicephalus microplus]
MVLRFNKLNVLLALMFTFHWCAGKRVDLMTFLKQGSTIWTLYSNITANMTCQNDRVTHKNWRHVTLNRTFLNESKKSSFIIKDVITMSFPEFTDSLLIPPYKGPTYLIEKILFQSDDNSCGVFDVQYYKNNAVNGPSGIPFWGILALERRDAISARYLPTPGSLLSRWLEVRVWNSTIDQIEKELNSSCIKHYGQYRPKNNKTIYNTTCRQLTQAL